MGLHIKKGDTVLVARGKDKGKTGTVLLAIPDQQKVVVQGVNVVKRHVKPSQANPQGGIEQREAAIHIAKLRLLDPETGKPTRIRSEIVDGKKVRVAVKSGKVF